MDTSRLLRKSETEWWIEPFGEMNVPGIIYATETLIRDMDDKVFEQVVNVAKLPGIVKASFAMPDAHWGYGFRLAAWLHSIQIEVVLFRPAVWGSTSPVACERCIRV